MMAHDGRHPEIEHVAQVSELSVRDILVRESGDGWAWSHKTGTSLSSTPQLGWLVGIAENGDRRWVFAMNVDLEPVDDLAGEVRGESEAEQRRTLRETVPVAATCGSPSTPDRGPSCEQAASMQRLLRQGSPRPARRNRGQ